MHPAIVWISERAFAPKWLAAVYLLGIILAELITNLANPQVGMILHGLLLIVLLVHGAHVERRPLRQLFYALSLAPLIRLMSLSLPLSEFPMGYWYLIVGAPLLIAGVISSHTIGFNRGMLGLKFHAIPIQILAGTSGIILGYLEYLILKPDPLAEKLTLEQIWLPALILLIFTGFLEEFVFRGIMQYAAIRSLGRIGIWYIAAVFAAMHIGYRSLLDIIFVFVAAMFFGLITHRTGSILGVTLAHGLTNIGLFLIFPFLFSTPETLINHLPAPPAIMAPTFPTRKPAPNTLSPTSAPPTNTPAPSPTNMPTATVTDVPTETPFVCLQPEGWLTYTHQPGDTVQSLSQRYGVLPKVIREANCLQNANDLLTRTQIYLPLPQPVPTHVPYNYPTLLPTNTIPAQIQAPVRVMPPDQGNSNLPPVIPTLPPPPR